MKQNVFLIIGLCMIMGISAAIAQEDVSTSPWSVSFGPVYRTGMKLNVSGSSYVQQGGYGAVNSYRMSGASGSVPQNQDDTSQYADRTFDNGFVNIDPSTVNFGGDTWYWGYDDAGQYNAGADTLTFQREQSYTLVRRYRHTYANELRNEDICEEADLDAFGIRGGASRLLVVKDRWNISMAMGFDFLPNYGHDKSFSTYEQTVSQLSVEYSENFIHTDTYTYDLMGVVPPSAPYEGTYDGPGPLLPNLPENVSASDVMQSSTSRRLGTQTWTMRNEIDLDVNAAMYELWLKPDIRFMLSDTVNIKVAPGISMILSELEAKREERWLKEDSAGSQSTITTWHDSNDDEEWLFGLGIDAAIEYKPTQRIGIGIGGGYEWVPDKHKVTIGPNDISLDLSSWTMNAYLNCEL